MSVKQKYIKDENGEIFSPIVSEESVYYNTGNDIQPKALMVTAQNDFNIDVSTAWSENTLILNKIIVDIGSGFTLGNNKVIVGSGIKYVKVSSGVGIWRNTRLFRNKFKHYALCS